MSVGEVMVFLDQSSNSKVYAVIHQCQSTYALKVIQHNVQPANECLFEHQRECSHLRNEFDLLSVLDHPSIIRPIGFSYGKDACQLKTELAQCSLQAFFDKNHKYIKMKYIQKSFKQIASGIQYLHQHNYAHNDIRLQNFLYFGNQTIKIADFGHTRHINQNAEQYENWKRKNWLYLSPELVQLKKFNNVVVDEQKSDIFSFGISLFLALFGSFPFCLQNERENDRVYKFICQNDEKSFWKHFEVKIFLNNEQDQILYEQSKKLLFQMLSQKPEDRPSINEILESQFFSTI